MVKIDQSAVLQVRIIMSSSSYILHVCISISFNVCERGGLTKRAF